MALDGRVVVAIFLLVFGLGFIFLAVVSPTNDMSVTINTKPPLSMLVNYDPYSGTVTIRGTNQDARPVEGLTGIVFLVLGVLLLRRKGHFAI